VAERDSPPQKALFLGPRERIKEGGKSPVRWKGGENRDRGNGECLTIGLWDYTL